MKFHPLSWRTAHPYVVADRFEDVTPPERVQMNKKCDRNVTVYGYLRGCNLKKGTKVGDFVYSLSELNVFPMACQNQICNSFFFIPFSIFFDLVDPAFRFTLLELVIITWPALQAWPIHVLYHQLLKRKDCVTRKNYFMLPCLVLVTLFMIKMLSI